MGSASGSCLVVCVVSGDLGPFTVGSCGAVGWMCCSVAWVLPCLQGLVAACLQGLRVGAAGPHVLYCQRAAIGPSQAAE